MEELRRENALLSRSREALAMELKRAKDKLSEREAEAEVGDGLSKELEGLKQNNRILIEELEAQELEIERLFKDNHELGRQCLEAQERAMSWKDMCTDLATQNERLQEMLQESASWSFENAKTSEETENEELIRLKDQVLQFEKLYREEQALNVKKDNSVKDLRAKTLALVEEKIDAQNTFIPVLATIEHRLLKLQQSRKARSAMLQGGLR